VERVVWPPAKNGTIQDRSLTTFRKGLVAHSVVSALSSLLNFMHESEERTMSVDARATVSRTPWEQVSVRSDYLAQRIAESANGSLVIDDMLCQVVDDMQSISSAEVPLDSEARESLLENDSFDFTPTLLVPQDTPATAEEESPSEAKRRHRRRFPRLVIL
jgi:hypothetical protein